jgi:peptidoglycan DL-endopeptidase CwlO
MAIPLLFRVGVVAVAVPLLLSGCTASSLGSTLGITPGAIVSTVIANLPRDDSNARSGSPSGSGRTTSRRIPRSPAPSAAAARILRTADSYLGTRYVWGGSSPREGFDCSGFTKYVFAKHGIALPRVSRDQARAGQAVPADFRALIPGDLMFFAEPGEAVSHVAMYVGNGTILHASGALGEVGYTDLNTGGEWYVAYFVAARRYQ